MVKDVHIFTHPMDKKVILVDIPSCSMIAVLVGCWSRLVERVFTLPMEKKVILGDIPLCSLIAVPVGCWSRPVEAVKFQKNLDLAKFSRKWQHVQGT